MLSCPNGDDSTPIYGRENWLFPGQTKSWLAVFRAIESAGLKIVFDYKATRLLQDLQDVQILAEEILLTLQRKAKARSGNIPFSGTTQSKVADRSDRRHRRKERKLRCFWEYRTQSADSNHSVQAESTRQYPALIISQMLLLSCRARKASRLMKTLC